MRTSVGVRGNIQCGTLDKTTEDIEDIYVDFAPVLVGVLY